MEKKVETDKFIINYLFNEKSKSFEKFSYINKNLNKIEIQILDKICILCLKLRIQELYEHAIIRVENEMRNFLNTKYEGVLFSENIGPEFKYFRKFFRSFFKGFVGDELTKKINFQYKKPENDWFFLNDDEKKRQIINEINNFKLKKRIEFEINLLRIENKSDLYIYIQENIDSNTKGDLCLDLEIFLKSIEETITVYFDWKGDKNKLRRLKV